MSNAVDILIVEDVIDTGLTLNYLVRTFGLRSPGSLAAITLLGSDGQKFYTVVSDERGSFNVVAPAGRQVRLRAERIGYETVTSELLDPRPGEVSGQDPFQGTEPGQAVRQPARQEPLGRLEGAARRLGGRHDLISRRSAVPPRCR